jgi:hypothetical protein
MGAVMRQRLQIGDAFARHRMADLIGVDAQLTVQASKEGIK